jgi:hypothetical protein
MELSREVSATEVWRFSESSPKLDFIAGLTLPLPPLNLLPPEHLLFEAAKMVVYYKVAGQQIGSHWVCIPPSLQWLPKDPPEAAKPPKWRRCDQIWLTVDIFSYQLPPSPPHSSAAGP